MALIELISAQNKPTSVHITTSAQMKPALAHNKLISAHITPSALITTSAQTKSTSAHVRPLSVQFKSHTAQNNIPISAKIKPTSLQSKSIAALMTTSALTSDTIKPTSAQIKPTSTQVATSAQSKPKSTQLTTSVQTKSTSAEDMPISAILYSQIQPTSTYIKLTPAQINPTPNDQLLDSHSTHRKKFTIPVLSAQNTTTGGFCFNVKVDIFGFSIDVIRMTSCIQWIYLNVSS